MTLLFWRDWEGCAVYLKMETKNRMTIYLILLIPHSCFMSKRSLYFILEHQTNLPQPIYSCISPIVHQSNFTCLYLRKSFIITLIDFLSENMYVIILSATFLMGGFRATRCMLHKTRWLQKMICSSIKISLILFGMFYYSWMNQRTFVSAVCFFFFLAGHHRDKRETWFWVIFFYVDMRCSFVALAESIKNTIKKALHHVLQHDWSEGFTGAGTQCATRYHREEKKSILNLIFSENNFFSDLTGDSIHAVLMSLWSLKVKLRLI